MFIVLLLVAAAQVQQIFPFAAPLTIALFVGTALVLGLRKRPVAWIIWPSLFVAYAVASVFVNQSDAMMARGLGFWADEARAVYMVVLLVAFGLCWSPRRDWRMIVEAAIWANVAIALVSLVAFVGPRLSIGALDIGAMHKPGRDVTVGLLGTKNPFAGSIGQIIVAVLALGGRPTNSFKSWRKLAGILALVCAFVLAGSRGFAGGVIASALATEFMVARRERKEHAGRAWSKRRRAIVLFGVAALGFAFVRVYSDAVGKLVSANEQNLVRRLALNERAFEIFSVSPLTGLGPGAVQEDGLSWKPVLPHLIATRVGGRRPDHFIVIGDLPIGQNAHDVLLQGLVDYGIIGLLLFMVPLGKAVAKDRSLLKDASNADSAALQQVIISLIIYLLVSGMFGGYTLYTPSTAWLLFALVGIRISHGYGGGLKKAEV